MLSHAVRSAAQRRPGRGWSWTPVQSNGDVREKQAESPCRHSAANLPRTCMSADADASKVPGTVTSKVPAVTLGFWIIKIAATTLGETGGDTLSMTFNLGYLLSTLIFATALVILVACQIAAKKFHPVLYWATIIASTTAGTTLADFADRSLDVGYAGGSSILFLCLIIVLASWYWSLGSIS